MFASPFLWIPEDSFNFTKDINTDIRIIPRLLVTFATKLMSQPCFPRPLFPDIFPSQNIKDRLYQRLNSGWVGTESIARSIILTVLILVVISAPPIFCFATL
jgi:hypothetical protein